MAHIIGKSAQKSDITQPELLEFMRDFSVLVNEVIKMKETLDEMESPTGWVNQWGKQLDERLKKVERITNNNKNV